MHERVIFSRWPQVNIFLAKTIVRKYLKEKCSNIQFSFKYFVNLFFIQEISSKV